MLNTVLAAINKYDAPGNYVNDVVDTGCTVKTKKYRPDTEDGKFTFFGSSLIIFVSSAGLFQNK